MNTCKDCKWWGRTHANVCGKIDTLFAVENPMRMFEIEATAADDHNLRAHLVTGPDFGCIQFDPKETT